MNTATIRAERLRADTDGGSNGDFIPGLDNAYVVEVSVGGTTGDRYSGYRNNDGYVEVTAHNANGDEIEIRLPIGTPVTVQRHGKFSDTDTDLEAEYEEIEDDEDEE